MPRPKPSREPSGLQARPMLGMANAPLSLLVCPASPTGGKPGPSAPAATLELTRVCGKTNSALASISERPRPVIVAGFQNMAPAALRGAATATPPNDRLIGPVPDKIAPSCARALAV